MLREGEVVGGEDDANCTHLEKSYVACTSPQNKHRLHMILRHNIIVDAYFFVLGSNIFLRKFASKRTPSQQKVPCLPLTSPA